MIKNIKRRIFSVLCAFSMISISIEQPAVLSRDILNTDVPIYAQASAIASGSCGGELRWILDSDGTLNITGNDEMTSAPWKVYSSQIKRVVIDKDVKNIYDYAFNSCSNLTSVTIPDSVLTIGRDAFIGTKCYENEGGVHYIGSWLVGSDKDITNAVIRDGTRKMADYSFNDRISLSSVTIPESLGTITKYAFYGTGLTTLTIPNTIISIEDCAFKFCTNLIELKIESSEFSGSDIIGKEAFSNCNRLKKISLPKSVQYVMGKAFFDCTDLETIEVWNPKCRFDTQVFDYSSGRTYGTIDVYGNEPSTIKSIANSNNNMIFFPMGGNGSLSDGTTWSYDSDTHELGIYGSGILNITDSYPFNELSSVVNSLVVTGDYDSIENFPLNNMSHLEKVTFSCSAGKISDGLLSRCSELETVILPDNIPEIPTKLFYECKNLINISIPDSVRNIGESAFSGCSSLSAIIIPDSVTNIGKGAFNGCSSLTKITLPNGVEIIEADTFKNCSNLSTITLPDSVLSVGDNTFSGCSSLTEITISNLNNIGSSVFDKCNSISIIKAGCNLKKNEKTWKSGCDSDVEYIHKFETDEKECYCKDILRDNKNSYEYELDKSTGILLVKGKSRRCGQKVGHK